nr:hypothetical protein [Tanacetum cinerariifolium]
VQSISVADDPIPPSYTTTITTTKPTSSRKKKYVSQVLTKANGRKFNPMVRQFKALKEQVMEQQKKMDEFIAFKVPDVVEESVSAHVIMKIFWRTIVDYDEDAVLGIHHWSKMIEGFNKSKKALVTVYYVVRGYKIVKDDMKIGLKLISDVAIQILESKMAEINIKISQEPSTERNEVPQKDKVEVPQEFMGT